MKRTKDQNISKALLAIVALCAGIAIGLVLAVQFIKWEIDRSVVKMDSVPSSVAETMYIGTNLGQQISSDIAQQTLTGRNYQWSQHSIGLQGSW